MPYFSTGRFGARSSSRPFAGPSRSRGKFFGVGTVGAPAPEQEPYLVTLSLNRSIIQDTNVPPLAQVVAGTGGTRLTSTEQVGDLRQYASGRSRGISRPTQTRTLTLTMRALTPVQVKQLEDWIGQTLLFRDAYGQRVFGTYYKTDTTWIPLSNMGSGPAATGGYLADVVLIIKRVTFIETIQAGT